MSKVTTEDLHLEGQFVGGTETDELANTLDTLKKANKTNVIINFTEVKYLSSIVIGILVKNNSDFISHRGKIVYCGINQTLEKVFKMLKLWQTLIIADTLDEAKAKF